MSSFDDSSLSLTHISSFFDVRRIPSVGPLFAMILRVSLASVSLFSRWTSAGIQFGGDVSEHVTLRQDHSLKQLQRRMTWSWVRSYALLAIHCGDIDRKRVAFACFSTHSVQGARFANRHGCMHIFVGLIRTLTNNCS
jgi:hypothetical protein